MGNLIRALLPNMVLGIKVMIVWFIGSIVLYGYYFLAQLLFELGIIGKVLFIILAVLSIPFYLVIAGILAKGILRAS